MLKRILQRWRYSQRSQLTIIRHDGHEQRVVHETSDWIEAPNWSPDGQWLVFNGSGKLFRIRVEGSQPPQLIDTGHIQTITNDHLYSPDGHTLYFTADGCIFAIPFKGGEPIQISQTDSDQPILLYLHGISPDARWLSCVGIKPHKTNNNTAIYLLPTSGGQGKRVTSINAAVDGPEFSPDGQWIYFNSALNARRPGDSQLFRMRIDGSRIEQLTFDSRVNWFPHIAPNGTKVVYLSYAENTQGHPTDCDVLLRCIDSTSGQTNDVVSLYGGQGTINTNSWAPDSTQFAYVAYPLIHR